MNKAGDKSFIDKNCKAQMRSLIPLRERSSNFKRPDEIPNTEKNRNVKRFAWNPDDTEPEPRLPMEKMILLKKVQEEQKHIAENQYELMRRISMIKDRLQEVKIKIETMTQDQKTIDACIEGCQDCGGLIKLTNQKSIEHRNLMRCIEQEDKLMIELQKTQREICEASVAGQAFSLEMEKEIDSIYAMYQSRKEYLIKRRIRRENTIDNNTRYAHNKIVKEVINSLTKANRTNQRKIQSAKILSIKTTKTKMKKYFQKTLEDREMQKRKAEEDREIKLSNRKFQLSRLKTELDRQKDILRAENQIKQKKRQQEEVEKDALKREMLLSGENPYLQDRILKNVDKSIKIKTTIEKVKDEIQNIVMRSEEIVQAKEREEMNKKKWERIWAQRLKEKKYRDLKKKKEMYGILPKETVPTTEETSDEKIEPVKKQDQELSSVYYNDELFIDIESIANNVELDLSSEDFNSVIPRFQLPDVILLNESPIMDFGKICLGDTCIKEYKFANVSGKTVEVKMDIINPYGPFTQCNALRKIEPKDTYTLRIRYTPTDYDESEEWIYVFGGDTKILLILRGCCVIPQFYINPLKSEIYIGKIQAQSVGSYQFEIFNPSEGDVTFSLELDTVGPFMGRLSIINEESEEPAPQLIAPSSLPTGRSEAPPNSATSHNPGPPPPPPEVQNPQNAHPKNRRNSSASAASVKSGSAGEIPKPGSKGRRRSSQARRHSAARSVRNSGAPDIPTEELPITPPPFVGPFEIIQDGVPKLLHLREMLDYLKEEKQPIFFQAIPSKLTVKAMATEKFVVYFIPIVPGRYFGGFKVVMFGNVVHEFNVVGIATAMRGSSGGKRSRSRIGSKIAGSK